MGLLLETVQDVDCAGKSHCVHGAICVAIEIFDDFQNAWTFSSPGLGRRVFPPELGNAQRGTNPIPHWFGKLHQVTL
jgi:hypothetical protein